MMYKTIICLLALQVFCSVFSLVFFTCFSSSHEANCYIQKMFGFCLCNLEEVFLFYQYMNIYLPFWVGWALTHGVWVASNTEESYFTLRHTSDMIRDTYRDVDMFFFFYQKLSLVPNNMLQRSMTHQEYLMTFKASSLHWERFFLSYLKGRETQGWVGKKTCRLFDLCGAWINSHWRRQ